MNSIVNTGRFVSALMLVLLTSCHVDRLNTISFEILNKHRETVRIKCIGYTIQGKQAIDTVFTAVSGERRLIYFDDARVLVLDQYLRSDTIRFCKRIELATDSLQSPKNFVRLQEWEYSERNHAKVYSLSVDATDF
jgi:hypothetical protein